MSGDLALMLDVLPAGAAVDQYRQAVLNENLLGKSTRSARLKAIQHLRSLYALDPSTTGRGAADPSTSARVMVPAGPVPTSEVRSTPRSLASLRTGGLALTGTTRADCAAASPTAAADTRAAVSGRGSTKGASDVRARRCAASCFGP